MTVGADLPIGSELAGYRIEALLGRGGMGVVYRAHDLALDRPVALKILAPELAADVRFRERFLRESRVAASIDHPNVVPVYDAGEVAGELFIAMRYVEGSDLKRLLAEGPLPKERAVGVVDQVAAALDAAHARGLVHRDVKPSNVLVAEGEHVYLADFGLTRRLGEPGAALGAAQSLGTADYVAPEQIRGDEVDGRADLYSLGCLLFECLTGVPPFRRESELATLFAHLEEAPPAPPGLDPVMRTALVKDPDSRYQSGQELVEAARSALGLEQKQSRWPLALAVVGAALVAAAVAAYFAVRSEGGRSVATGSAVALDTRSAEVGSPIRVGNDPESIAVGGGSVWVGNFGDATVSRIDPGSRRVDTITVNGAPLSVTVVRDLAVVANGPPANSLTLVHANSTSASDLVSLPNAPTFGTASLTADRGGFWVADTQDARVTRFRVNPAGTVTRDIVAKLDPKGEFNGIAAGEGSVWVVGSDLDPRLWRIDPRSGRVTGVLRLPEAPRRVIAAAGGVWVAGEIEDVVLRIDPDTLRVVARIPVGRGGSSIAAGAGSIWVANRFDGTVSRIDPRTDRVDRTIRVGGSPIDLAVGAGKVWVARDGT
jgi:YVTN family beta-propeller protein